MFITQFDGSEAIIEPRQAHSKIEGMPALCIGVFSHVLVEAWIETYPSEVITVLESACGDRPVYKITVKGQEYCLFVPYLGAPAAVACLEELIVAGAQKFVFCGSCGVLQHSIADGHLIVPTAALRDEGLSFHYVPPADEIQLDPDLVSRAAGALQQLGLPFVQGKTWTTDAFYRETRGRMEQAKSMGAICVEMECAALAAVAQFRQVPFVQFLWSADSLAAEEWDVRGLDQKGLHVSEVCLTAALKIAEIL